MRPYVTMSDVTDVPACHFCGSPDLEWHDDGWAYCPACTAGTRFRRGEATDTEPPDDMAAVSSLLLELRSLT